MTADPHNMANNHSSNREYSFTGKERDAETGYSFFGARYYDSDLSGLFLSVDPMADKYPSISPYSYCMFNPIRVVDPIGMDTAYYNFKGNLLFSKAGGENVNMMILTEQTKMDEETFKKEGLHSFDLATLNFTTLDNMYDFSDKKSKECYYAVKGDGKPTNIQIGTEDDVPGAIFDAKNWLYNVHTHCKSKLKKESDNVMNNIEPSIDKDMVGIGGKFGIILGYTRRNKDVGSSGWTFSSGESPNKPDYQYKKTIGFYDSKGNIWNTSYDDFKKTVRKINTGR